MNGHHPPQPVAVMGEESTYRPAIARCSPGEEIRRAQIARAAHTVSPRSVDFAKRRTRAEGGLNRSHAPHCGSIICSDAVPTQDTNSRDGTQRITSAVSTAAGSHNLREWPTPE